MKRGVLGTSSMHSLIRKALRENPSEITGARGEDQSFLQTYVWPLVKADAIAHDFMASRCNTFNAALCLDFPIGNASIADNVFVGASFKEAGSNVGSYTCEFICNITRN